MTIIVKVQKIREDSKIPERATEGAIGFDVYASVVLDKNTRQECGNFPIEIKSGESLLLGIGVCMEIPRFVPAAIFSRSGLAMRYDIEVGCPGAPIDPDYRGEIAVLLRNKGKDSFLINKNMRIAQLVIFTDKIVILKEVKRLSKTKRGDKGLGSTGLY